LPILYIHTVNPEIETPPEVEAPHEIETPTGRCFIMEKIKIF
jgi:hypothetical protein